MLENLDSFRLLHLSAFGAQGIANAAGMAAAAKMAAAQFNTDKHTIFSNHIIALCGDGCMQVPERKNAYPPCKHNPLWCMCATSASAVFLHPCRLHALCTRLRPYRDRGFVRECRSFGCPQGSVFWVHAHVALYRAPKRLRAKGSGLFFARAQKSTLAATAMAAFAAYCSAWTSDSVWVSVR